MKDALPFAPVHVKQRIYHSVLHVWAPFWLEADDGCYSRQHQLLDFGPPPKALPDWRRAKLLQGSKPWEQRLNIMPTSLLKLIMWFYQKPHSCERPKTGSAESESWVSENKNAVGSLESPVQTRTQNPNGSGMGRALNPKSKP